MFGKSKAKDSTEPKAADTAKAKAPSKSKAPDTSASTAQSSDKLPSLREVQEQKKRERDARIAVVVGPEGGLSAGEVGELTSGPRSWPVTLGPTILRTETAGVVAPALVLYECGGMGAKGSER